MNMKFPWQNYLKKFQNARNSHGIENNCIDEKLLVNNHVRNSYGRIIQELKLFLTKKKKKKKDP